ncbi:hypothetical protein HBDW_36110 [Herbaspirillum sp. DW155]|uniref:hypothetical protein n=1 Tax=Herbaspirillum sp. DW155 TaxID=3095609 RepID=UPI00309288A5|nr:hypothetical protein HBDW_36110 [Herbaspirillum sp. DW155]
MSRKTGNPWKMYRAQCVVTGGDNGAKVGELVLPDSLKDTIPRVDQSLITGTVASGDIRTDVLAIGTCALWCRWPLRSWSEYACAGRDQLFGEWKRSGSVGGVSKFGPYL